MNEKEGIEKKIKILTTNQKAILILSVVLMISSFLPWISIRVGLFTTIDFLGIEGDGLIILCLGALLCLIVFFARSHHTLKKRSSLIIGAVCAFICISDSFRVSRLITEYSEKYPEYFEYIHATLGIGIYLAILISIGLIVLGIVKDKEVLIEIVNDIRVTDEEKQLIEEFRKGKKDE